MKQLSSSNYLPKKKGSFKQIILTDRDQLNLKFKASLSS